MYLHIHQTSHNTSGTQKLHKSVKGQKTIGMGIFEASVIEAHTAEIYVHIHLDTKHIIKRCILCFNNTTKETHSISNVPLS